MIFFLNIFPSNLFRIFINRKSNILYRISIFLLIWFEHTSFLPKFFNIDMILRSKNLLRLSLDNYLLNTWIENIKRLRSSLNFRSDLTIFLHVKLFLLNIVFYLIIEGIWLIQNWLSERCTCFRIISSELKLTRLILLIFIIFNFLRLFCICRNVFVLFKELIGINIRGKVLLIDLIFNKAFRFDFWLAVILMRFLERRSIRSKGFCRGIIHLKFEISLLVRRNLLLGFREI